MLPKFVTDPSPERYMTDNYLVLDFETDTSYGDYGSWVHPENHILLACWCLGPGHPLFEEEGRVYSVWGNEYEMRALVDHLRMAELLVAHNAQYELGWLQRAGADISRVLTFCTKIAEYVLSGNLKLNTSLDVTARRRGLPSKDPVVDHMIKDGVNPIDIPRKWLNGRCIQDVWTTEHVFLDQRETLRRTNRLGVQYTRCWITPVLADISKNGMALDPVRVEEEYQKELQNKNKLEVEIQKLFGDINPNSPIQIAEYLYETLGFEELLDRRDNPIRTAKGKAKTDKETILALKAKTKEQKLFKKVYTAYNQSSQRLSKFLDFFKGVCDEHDGVFYAEFNQTNTKTHRLSSSGKKIYLKHVEREGSSQFQNQPRIYKRLYKAKREGYKFVEEDGSSLEFIVAGFIGNDDSIKRDINNPDFDAHRRSASIIRGVDESEVTKEWRTLAKAHTFKPLFGGESGTAGEKRYYKSFNERYQGLVHTQEGWLAEAETTKRLVLPWGLQFYWPWIKRDRSGYVNERTKVFNAPIQSFATADIIPIQMGYMWHMVQDRGLQDYIVMVNTVHDSVLSEVHEDYMDEYKEIVLESWRLVYFYLKKVYGMSLEGMPLGTEITVGDHWSEGDDESYKIWEDRVEAA